MEEKVYEIYKLIIDANSKMAYLWKAEMLFKWRWWLLVILTITPWLLWIKFKRKESTYRLLLVGVIIMLITSYLDFIGVILGAWHYNWKVVPIIPGYIPWDFSLFPVFIMFLLQYKAKISPFIKALIFSSLSTFVFEPFFRYLKIYCADNWKSIYSFPIYIIIYLFADFLVKRDEFEKI